MKKVKFHVDYSFEAGRDGAPDNLMNCESKIADLALVDTKWALSDEAIAELGFLIDDYLD